jgi:hypothetical protein
MVYLFSIVYRESNSGELIYVKAPSMVEATKRVSEVVNISADMSIQEMPDLDIYKESCDKSNVYEWITKGSTISNLYPVNTKDDIMDIVNMNPVSLGLFTENARLLICK